MTVKSWGVVRDCFVYYMYLFAHLQSSKTKLKADLIKKKKNFLFCSFIENSSKHLNCQKVFSNFICQTCLFFVFFQAKVNVTDNVRVQIPPSALQKIRGAAASEEVTVVASVLNSTLFEVKKTFQYFFFTIVFV